MKAHGDVDEVIQTVIHCPYGIKSNSLAISSLIGHLKTIRSSKVLNGGVGSNSKSCDLEHFLLHTAIQHSFEAWQAEKKPCKDASIAKHIWQVLLPPASN